MCGDFICLLGIEASGIFFQVRLQNISSIGSSLRAKPRGAHEHLSNEKRIYGMENLMTCYYKGGLNRNSTSQE